MSPDDAVIPSSGALHYGSSRRDGKDNGTRMVYASDKSFQIN